MAVFSSSNSKRHTGHLSSLGGSADQESYHQCWPHPCSPPPVVLICLLLYGQLLEQSRHSWVNTTTLITGCTNAAGLVVVGNFQVRPLVPLWNFP